MIFYKLSISMNLKYSRDKIDAIKEAVRAESELLKVPLAVVYDYENLTELEMENVSEPETTIKHAADGFNINVVVGLNATNFCIEKFVQSLKESLEVMYKDKIKDITCSEVASQHLIKRGSMRGNNPDRELLKKVCDTDVGLGYEIVQLMCSKEVLTLEAALQRAEEMLLDDAFVEEIKRIFASENPKTYMGHPVHYVINANCTKKAKEMVNLLVECLYSNHRVLSRRIDVLYNINPGALTSDQPKELLYKTVCKSSGATLVIDSEKHKYSSPMMAKLQEKDPEAEILCRFIGKTLSSRCDHTLTIITKLDNKPCFDDSLMLNLEEDMLFIILGEKRCSAEQAKKNVLAMLKDSLPGVDIDPESISMPAEKQEYTLEDTKSILQKTKVNLLRRNVYSVYGEIADALKVDTAIDLAEQTEGEAYDELMGMIGLKNVKKLINQLLDKHKINELRKKAGLRSQVENLHMVFSGNPGSAKTTVARLLAKILAEKGIISKAKFVECSRADLVGKYVGWTADIVNDKFIEARGGVLFIDEAYSLIGEGKDFGQEAINAIVQGMENNRNDTIVIFAGYPDKMRQFIKQNEGLKSRIGFIMDFPDYSEAELSEILEYMAEKQDYVVDEAAKAKYQQLIYKAVKIKNFGNGRYVRNLLDKAILHQAVRLAESGQDEFKAAELQHLLPEDFTEVDSFLDDKYKPVGFEL